MVERSGEAPTIERRIGYYDDPVPDGRSEPFAGDRIARRSRVQREADDVMGSAEGIAREVASALEYLGLDAEPVGEGTLIVRGELASFEIVVEPM